MIFMRQNLIVSSNISNFSDGIFKAATSTWTNKIVKLRVEKDDHIVTYNLNSGGKFETFPLQFGCGKYHIILYKNTKNKKYEKDGDIYIQVKLVNEFAPYLRSNQYINYGSLPILIDVAKRLHDNESQAIATASKIMDFIEDNFTYDYIKSVTVKDGEMPDIAKCFSSKTGICQDLAALAVALFRINRIPAKLEIGKYGKNLIPHAWVKYYINGWNLYDPTAELNGLDYKDDQYYLERWY